MARKLARYETETANIRQARRQKFDEKNTLNKEPEVQTHYQNKLQKLNKDPLRPQTDAQKRYMSAIDNFTLTIATGPAGTGKAQPLDAKIATPNGFVAMGDLAVGSEIVGSDGKATRVTAIYPQGEKEIFKISFEDGRTTECCDEHLWRVYCYEWTDKWRTLPTIDLRKLLAKKSYKNRLYVQLVKPVETVEQKLELHPFVVGSLIGDGCMTQNSVLLATADVFIADKFESLLPENYELVHRSDFNFSVVKIDREKSKENVVNSACKNLGLDKFSYEKQIPEIYMNGSISQKLELLQGLFDADGTVDKKTGSVSYCTTSPILANQIQFLIRSLGGLAKISNKKTSFTYKGEIKSGRLAYNISVRIPNAEALFSLKRKSDLAKKNIQYRECLRLRINSIESLDKKQAQCISVQAEDHLYVTDDFIVTHNTYIAASMAAKALQDGDIDRIIITRPAVEAGESLGFLPGELEEKFDPYLQPFREVLEERLGKSQVEMFMKNGHIDARPLAYMRGSTFKNAFVILDEAQNTTPTQMKMFLTRIGYNCKVIVNGDIDQCDINGLSGLEDAVKRITYIPEVKHIVFKEDDIVRSGLVREIVCAYRK